MKKKIFCLLVCSLLIINVYGNSNSFSFDGNLIFNAKSKSESIATKFEQSYRVSSTHNSEDDKMTKDFVKEVTYYLLGAAGSTIESSKSYIERKLAFYDLRYAPDIPVDSEGNFDTNSQEYKDDLVSGLVIPNIFIQFNDLEIVYNEINDIQIVKVDDGFFAQVTLLDAEMKVVDDKNPINYKTINANINIYYYFKVYMGKYKLYYMYGEYDDELDVYNDNIVQKEYRGINSVNTNKSDLSDLYNYAQLNKLSNSKIKEIYNNNKNNILIFNTIDNQNVSNVATGFFISNNIAVTTWSYLEKSLVNGSYITVKDGNGNLLNLEGIVSVDIDNDYAVLKVSGSNSKGVKFGSKPNIEDAAIIISTKTGSVLSTNLGIVMTNENGINTLIPTLEYEEGAPVFNANGQVVGMNSSKITGSYFSKAYSNDVFIELQNKFKTLDINNISYISFEELKNSYYVQYGADKIINNIDDKVWNKYKKIGNLENNISLELIKASYKDSVLSLRYKNKLSSVFDNMSLASAFIKQLKIDGYEEKINNSIKKVYSNNKYRVTIMSDFDYLIIVIAEI